MVRAMLTFKQLEALFWIARLGGYGPASQRLHTSQSALSKRVAELESVLGLELFDRTLRTARLTAKGEEMFALAKKMLEQRDAAIEQIGRLEVVERRIRIGVTEVTAMTWLHRLVELMQDHYPKVTIEPDVDASVNLREKLLADELDLVFVPDAFAETRLETKEIGGFTSAWMCKPGLVQSGKVYRLHELAAHRLLLQGSRSGVGMIHDAWMSSLGVQPTNYIIINNLVAMIGLSLSGLGIGQLPEECLAPMIENGSLVVVPCTPAPPRIRYVAMYKSESRGTLIASIVMLAQECCDFGRMFEIDRGDAGRAAKSP